MRLDKKVSIITGGAKGIGKAIAVEFVKEGSNIVIADIDYDNAIKVAEKINSINGEKSIAMKMDVTNYNSILETVDKTIDRFGKIDILVNNAGANYKNWVKDLPENEWDKVINVNLKGTFLCSKAVLPNMISNKIGRIINIVSIGGKKGEAAGSAYCSSKFGQIGFTQCLALEVAEYNILVNAICPGPIPTELGEYGIEADAKLRGLELEEFRQWFIDRTPLKRQGKPEQVSRMCVFIASDECDFTTGCTFDVNGGIIMH